MALDPPASVTVTVIVLVPLALGTGVSVIVRLAPLPPTHGARVSTLVQ